MNFCMVKRKKAFRHSPPSYSRKGLAPKKLKYNRIRK